MGMDEIFLKLISSQPKLFNNNFELLRELTGLDPDSFGFLMSLFRGKLNQKSQAAIDFVSTHPTCYAGEIYALTKDLKKTTPSHQKESALMQWGSPRYNFEEVLSSLLTTDEYLMTLDNFRVTKSQNATEIFYLRFTDGLVNEIDVAWWNDFNKLCIDIKYLDALQTQWTSLSDEQKKIVGSVCIEKNNTLNQFMLHDISPIHKALIESLENICEDAPFTKEYLLGHDWCYSEYSIVLKKNGITPKNQLDIINDLSQVLTILMKLSSESSPMERLKMKKRIFNYLFSSDNIIKYLKKGYNFLKDV